MIKIRRVCGDSMEPNIKNGSIAIVASFLKSKSGDVVLVQRGPKEFIKRIKNIDSDGRVYLSADNFFGSDSRNWGRLSGSSIKGKVIVNF